MQEKLRKLKVYLELQIRETERLQLIAASIHDTVTAEKWELAVSIYKAIYAKIFGDDVK